MIKVGLALALVGCTGPAAETDCSILKTDRAHAITRLSMSGLERCVAPMGTDCERAAALFTQMPAMIPRWSQIEKAANTKAICDRMPPTLQKCLFPSYVVGHQPECAGAPAAARAAATLR
ncbi:MAG: hypothetical protein NT062_06185 [Proteobacteria bacterium]|nr:hypothetical protein [Pseudomonadota bacterium]